MDETNVTNTSVETETNQTEEVRMYTAEEVDALIQRESERVADKRVSQALKTQQKKYEKQLSLAKLDDAARAQEEKNIEIEELKAQIAQMRIESNKSEIKSVFASRGMPVELVDHLVMSDDITECQATIDAVDKLFKAAVKAEVEKRLAGSVPKGNGTSSNGTPTKADIMKMSLAEQQKFKNANPQLYNAIFNN